MTFLLEKNRLGRHMIYKKAKDMILTRTRGYYPAPLKALDVIYDCLDRGLTDSLKIGIFLFTSHNDMIPFILLNL